MSDEVPDPDGILAELGFDASANVLTRRQAEVLALRERGVAQAAIAERLGTSRANVSSVESSARENVEKAERTVELARALRSAVNFTVPSGSTFEDIIDGIYNEGDRSGISIKYTRPELQSILFESLETYARGDQLETAIEVGVRTNGTVEVYPARSLDAD